MDKLTELANKYGTDKGTMSYGHGYSVTYEEFFKDLVDKPIRLLEIGVCDPRFPGASLKMWEEYFPHGKIIGMDINPDARHFTTNRTHIWIGDQNSPVSLRGMALTCGPNFDIIIDDGSHVGEHILTSFKTLWNYLKLGGYYIIEDLHSVYTNAEVTIPKLKEFIKEEKLDLDIQYLYGGKLIVIKKSS
jgi:demethylmacrocin O-methyltransferase